MKKVMIAVIFVLLVSGCILLPENAVTPFPPSQTQISNATLPSTASVERTQIQETPMPTATVVPSKTSIPTQQPTQTSMPQITATPFPIKLQPGSPAHIKNYAHASEGCEWAGVAGQIFDNDGKPLINSVVIITGKIDGKTVEFIGVTGVPEANIYGPGGYEVKISNNAFSSEKLLSIQVFDLEGIPISGSVPFDTYSECEKNLVIINFHYKE